MRVIVLLSFVWVLLGSCGRQVDPLFTMDMEVNFEIPTGLSSILTHTFVINDVFNPLESYLSAFGVDTSDITTIQAGRGEFAAQFISTDYNFIQRVSIWMVSNSNPNLRSEIYYLDFNSGNNSNNTLKLLSAVSNVKEQLREETFTLEIKLEFSQITTRLIENKFIFKLIALE